jgi:molecular chaperone GrpE (heat shock protein)
MHSKNVLRAPKWPFFLGDALCVALAAFICFQSSLPLSVSELLACIGSVGFGAVLGVLPFLLEYRALVQVAQTDTLTTVVEQIRDLESVARQISSATSQWQSVQESADKTAALARDMTDRITAEARAFSKFLEQANDTEKGVLRLEVEKLRRAESDSLQVVIRILDHVFALHGAAVRSGRPDVTEQLTQFRNACQDAARRVGLVSFVAAAADSFDGQKHQLTDSEVAEPGATVAETIAAGYTFQGRLLRRALVRLRKENSKPSSEVEPTEVPAGQRQLPLGAAP